MSPQYRSSISIYDISYLMSSKISAIPGERMRTDSVLLKQTRIRRRELANEY